MSGFLSKSKQRFEHTSKLNVGEFKSLQSLIGQEKNLLNSHVRVANDLRKASHSLDEWAQSEGPDLADTLGKVAKLLANDLAKAEEEYAEHLSNFRMYFKQLRTREERFSQLKKNKETLQGKIDSAEKKLAKMSPEHKDLATWTQKLSELRNEMAGMDNSVINEEAAIGDYRRQTARSAVAHQLAALCQLGEKMTIIGELGKLLTYEIRLDKTEPGRDRSMYNSYDRTLQIYGEAQTCLHKVVFDASNTEAAYSSLPVPSQGDFDHSYEFDQEAHHQSQEAEQQARTSKRQSINSRDPSLTTAGAPYTSHGLSPNAGSTKEGRSAVSSFQPLATPAHTGTESDFADAVNATWREQGSATDTYQSYNQSHALPTVPMYPSQDEAPPQEPATSFQPSPSPPQQAGHVYNGSTRETRNDPYGRAEYSREEDEYEEPEYVEEDQLVQQDNQGYQQREGITTINEETRSALQETELSAERGVGGFTNPSHTSSDRVQRHQLHDRPVPPDPDMAHGDSSNQQYAILPASTTAENAPSRDYSLNSTTNGDIQQDRPAQDFEPSGDDLYGTGLYGNAAETSQTRAAEITSSPREQSPPPIPTAEVTREPDADAPSQATYTEPPSITYVPPTSPKNIALPSSPPVPQTESNWSSRLPSGRPAQTPDLSAASALAAAAASSVRPRQNTQGSSKSIPKPQNITTNPPTHLSYTTVATSSKSPTSPVVPSPTRREKTPPAKQHSYRSEHKSRPDTNDTIGRSSIAYLNDTPVLEPPMRAPPPTNLGMPLPSSSPYFNPYANLRSHSGGTVEHAASTSGGLSGASGGRPKGARSSALDSSLGSKHGFELRTAPPAHERPLLQQPIANANANALRDKDYSYAIRTGDDGGGRRLAAGAFRRANPSSSSIPSFRSGGEDVSSPAQRLRDEWRSSQSVLPSPAAEFVTPAQTPGSLPADTPGAEARGYMDAGEDMYGERAASRMPLSHRTSAIDAPMDVMPNDDMSQSDLHQIAEGAGEGEENVLPLNVRKKSPNAAQTEFNAPNRADNVEAGEGFGGGQFVTKLE